MILVELTGPSGTGKSEVCKHLIEQYPDMVAMMPSPSLEQAISTINQIVPHKPELHSFCRLTEFIFNETKGKPRHDVRQSGCIRALAKSAAAPHIVVEDPRVMIVDGGILHRGQGVYRLMPEIIEQYYRIAPVPDLVVSFVCSLDTLKERNKGRVKTHGASHDRSNESEMSVAVHDTCMKVMLERGARLLEVDTENTDPKTNADFVANFIKETFWSGGKYARFKKEAAEGYTNRRKDQEKWIKENEIVAEFLEDVPAGNWVLDVPCGDGRFFELYKEKDFRVQARDIEPDMLKQAAQKAEAVDLFATICRDDITKLSSVWNDSVDVSLAIRVTRWLTKDDCRLAMKQLQRVTRDRIILTANIDEDNPYVRPLSLFLDCLEDDWELAEDREAHKPTYRVLMFKRKK